MVRYDFSARTKVQYTLPGPVRKIIKFGNINIARKNNKHHVKTTDIVNHFYSV